MGQNRDSPKLLKSKGNYDHTSTATVFPKRIENYSRKSVFSFTKKNDDIEVIYESPEKTALAISIYPAGDGAEDRLRNEYLKSLSIILNTANKAIALEQNPVQKIGAKYISNGFKAVLNLKEEITQMALYECGAWFLKIRITSKNLDSSRIEEWEEKVLNKYDPTKLTEVKPLDLKSDFIASPELGKDRERAKYILKNGFKKLEWANKNVCGNERASGFPDLYLNMHIAAYKEFTECKDENFKPDNDIAKLISDVNKVIKAGYLPEL